MSLSDNEKTFKHAAAVVSFVVSKGGTDKEELSLFNAYLVGKRRQHADEKAHMEEKHAKKLKTQKDESKAELKTKDDALEAQENIHKVELKKKDDEIKELKEKIKEWEKKAAPLLASLLE